MSMQMSIPKEMGKSHIRAHISKLEFRKALPWNVSFVAIKYTEEEENTIPWNMKMSILDLL